MAAKRISYSARSAFRWRRWAVVFTILFLIGAICLGTQYKIQHKMWWDFSRVTAWISEHRTHIHQHLVKVKTLAVRQPAPAPQLHFEFYTALPNMQVNVSERHPTKQVIDAEELEREFKEQIKST